MEEDWTRKGGMEGGRDEERNVGSEAIRGMEGGGKGMEGGQQEGKGRRKVKGNAKVRKKEGRPGHKEDSEAKMEEGTDGGI